MAIQSGYPTGSMLLPDSRSELRIVLSSPSLRQRTPFPTRSNPRRLTDTGYHYLWSTLLMMNGIPDTLRRRAVTTPAHTRTMALEARQKRSKATSGMRPIAALTIPRM